MTAKNGKDYNQKWYRGGVTIMIQIIIQITLIVTSFSILIFFGFKNKEKSGKKDNGYSLLSNPKYIMYTMNKDIEQK